MNKEPWDDDSLSTTALSPQELGEPGSGCAPPRRGPAAAVRLPKAERQSLFASLFGAAAKYCAMSTDAPRIPANAQLSLQRRIAMMRGLRGWTQRDLALQAKVTQTDVSRAEDGSLPANSVVVQKILARLETPG